MKKLLLISLLAYCLSPLAHSQDVQRFAERSVMGTARYVGMGGAMTAIGGDPSAALDNPAGLGLYRNSEISLTAAVNAQGSILKIQIPQVTAIWSSGKDKQKGLIYNNFLISYNQLHSFHQDIQLAGANLGMLPTICALTDGLNESSFNDDKIWDNTDIGWLSILGYDGYLIDPASDNRWTPAANLTKGRLSISETGAVNQYTIAWSGNISNQWYIGASINIPTINYSKNIVHYESDGNNYAELNSTFSASGVGVNASVGFIGRPTEWLRLGVALHTPTVLSMSLHTEGLMYSKIANNEYETYTPTGRTTSTCPTPLRTSISIAGQWKNIGMLSVQYDYAHTMRDKQTKISPMEDVHTLRAGLEAQVWAGWYINAGYVYESPFLKQDPVVGLDYNSIRTDIDYRYTQWKQYASVGIGYRNDLWLLTVAYQYGWQLLHQYASECQSNPIALKLENHYLNCTLGFRF